jgi:tRNA A37 threonylcarbamoyladenosine synthetase subunit TsaC/SUA5/YrdC
MMFIIFFNSNILSSFKLTNSFTLSTETVYGIGANIYDEQAVNKIADLKTTKEDFDSLNEYLENYKLIKNQIKNYTDGIRSAI